MDNKYIADFGDINKTSSLLVGGKGANLGEMSSAGFPVPRGFCVTTEAYRKFIEQNDLNEFIEANVKHADINNISPIGQRIRDKINGLDVPGEIADAVLAALDKYDKGNFYAVRSSATAEDLAFASFAGQQDTYLNVKGDAAALQEKIKNCWASLFTDRAILYRIQNGIEHGKVLMSVVVQTMVFPDVAGIMFTADPVSGNRNMISMEASYGLGEALVSGIVSPDIYKFDKIDGKISRKMLSEKKLAIIGIETGGTEQIEITGEKVTAQALSDEKILELAALGRKIEKHYSYPQDIEWCIHNEKLYILQSRAITSLYPIPQPGPKDGSLHAYVSFGHVQMLTSPISPMGISVLQTLIPVNRSVKSQSECRYLLPAGGRLYLDLNILLQVKAIRGKLLPAMRNVEELASKALETLVNRPDFNARLKADYSDLKALVKFAAPVGIKAARNYKRKDMTGATEKMNVLGADYIKKIHETINAKPEGIERLEALPYVMDFPHMISRLLPLLVPAMFSFSALKKKEIQLLGSNTYTTHIFKGLQGNITTEMGLQMADIADRIRRSPEILKEFENPDYATLLARIENLNQQDDLKKQCNDFLKKFGMRAAAEIDIASPRWCENPEPLAKAMVAIVKTSQENVHNIEHQQAIEKAKIAEKEFIGAVKAKYGKRKAKEMKRLVNVFTNTMPGREHPKYFLVNYLMAAKKVILTEAEKLAAKGWLETSHDVFYLNYWELCDAVRSPKNLKALVAQRKEEYDHFNKLTPPRVITSDGEIIAAEYNKKDLPESALIGTGVSAGCITGIAKVVLNPAETSVDKGEILVAPFTDPGWTPLFINSAGLVTEVGGMLTHGAVVAREYGIPAVVGVTDATRLIKTGQKIKVDGNAGYVMILNQ